MGRRLCVIFLGLTMFVFLGAALGLASNMRREEPDYSRLLDFIEMKDLQDPLVVFGAAEKDFDRRLNQENISYLNQNKELIRQIQSKLNGEQLKWQLNTSFKQLLVVPENRDEYAQLFEQYCRTVIDYLLNRIQMPTPYENIATLKGPLTSIPDHASKGITAYLVHNLAGEYIEEYLFFSENNNESKIKIKLSNREFDGKIGCYTSRLKICENNQFEFVRESYTLWQNSARNPLNVLIVPIEETLHILMRPSTESAMLGDLARSKPKQIDEVQRIIDDWMAVEEAIVGGIVWQVMPEVLARFVHKNSAGLLTQALAEREEHPQYRLLDHAIELVSDMGIDSALSVYKNNALDFRQMLDRAEAPIESAQGPQPHPLIN